MYICVFIYRGEDCKKNNRNYLVSSAVAALHSEAVWRKQQLPRCPWNVRFTPGSVRIALLGLAMVSEMSHSLSSLKGGILGKYGALLQAVSKENTRSLNSIAQMKYPWPRNPSDIRRL